MYNILKGEIIKSAVELQGKANSLGRSLGLGFNVAKAIRRNDSKTISIFIEYPFNRYFNQQEEIFANHTKSGYIVKHANIRYFYVEVPELDSYRDFIFDNYAKYVYEVGTDKPICYTDYDVQSLEEAKYLVRQLLEKDTKKCYAY